MRSFIICLHRHISVMELGHLLTRSGLTYPEVSSKVCHGSFCQLGNRVSLPWVIHCEAFYLHVVSSFSCIPVICLKLVPFLIPFQFVYLFCNLSKCILLFSCISSLLLKKTRIKLYNTLALPVFYMVAKPELLKQGTPKE